MTRGLLMCFRFPNSPHADHQIRADADYNNQVDSDHWASKPTRKHVDDPLNQAGTLSGFWTNHICCPRVSWRAFDNAWDAFQKFIDRLLPGLPQRTRSSMFFPSALRNPIMEAADTMTMLHIKYDGVERLVEPYELAFKVRDDGVGREYLYVHDTTGGHSKERRLKTFVSENTQWIQNTDKVFKPRYAVELRKSGGAERIGNFSRS